MGADLAGFGLAGFGAVLAVFQLQGAFVHLVELFGKDLRHAFSFKSGGCCKTYLTYWYVPQYYLLLGIFDCDAPSALNVGIILFEGETGHMQNGMVHHTFDGVDLKC